ncbi:MAG: NHLP bacteriocin export ABC transporter permease/ATPase subunit [Verrucomicrobia bacterium]|nr:NHLP bacteriocin export ABC transporter permease/ATPase subunit [Verrucomicrobiota bacterium]
MPAISAAISNALIQAGELQILRLNQTFVIEGSENVWFIASGRIDIFTVQLEGGEATGPRSHFLSLEAGSLIFGMDFTKREHGYCFLLTGHEGSELVQLRRDDLRRLARDHEYAATLSQLIDQWLEQLSASVSRDARPLPKADEVLVGGKQVLLPRGKIARARRGIVWIQILRGEALYMGMEGVSLSGEGVPVLPLSADTWIESYDDNLLSCFSTPASITQATFWMGLGLFHEVLCQCEFINKKLRIVDDFNRLRAREASGLRSRDTALREIAAVLAPGKDNRAALLSDSSGNPLVIACRIVAEAVGIQIRLPPDLHQVSDKLSAVAKASRFRFRTVALRGEWWEIDHGPLLAFREGTREPVAIVKSGPASYELVDPGTLDRVPVTPSVAATFAPFAASFYTPLPEKRLGARELIKFGLQDCKADLRTIIFMGVLTGLLGMVTPYFSGQIFDSIVPSADRSQLAQFAIALFAAALATFAFELTRAIAVLRLTGKMDYSVQAGVWDRLLNLPSTFFRDYTAGDLTDRALGVEQIRQAISQSGTQGIVGAISAAITGLFLFSFNYKMAWTAIALLVISVLLPMFINYLQLRNQRVMFRVRGLITGLVLQLINGVAKLRVSGAEDSAFREWTRKFSTQKRLSFRVGFLANIVQVFNRVFPLLATALLFYMYGYFKDAAAQNQEKFTMTTGQFVAFNGVFSNVLSSMLSLSGVVLDLLIIFPLFQRLRPIIEAQPEVDEAKAHPGELSGEVEVYHLSFRYSSDGPLILKDLSLRIRPGEFVALVGGSGSGKSTLLRLLLGFEKPESGAIFYDSQELSSLDLRAVRQQIGVVLQSSKLMPTDIYRNIIGSHSNLSVNDAWEAARMAGLDRDIKNMPMGMHTVVSEGGGTFSGGQRQRLMVARALVNRPRIIFFDEATSAMDNETQRTVTESLDAMQATRIVIAHRLSTIINADRIFVLQYGELVQSGTYTELMNQAGPFADLARRQLA